MRDLVVLFIHFITTLARLLGPGGVRSVVAESLLVKHQLLIVNRSRQRAPNLSASDRVLAGWLALWVRPSRLLRSAIVLKPSTLIARMSHRGGGERRKGARSGDGGRSRSRNHRNGPSSTVLLAVLAPRVAIFCQGKTHHSPDLLCCPMALGTCSLQQRRAATCNCRCT